MCCNPFRVIWYSGGCRSDRTWTVFHLNLSEMCSQAAENIKRLVMLNVCYIKQITFEVLDEVPVPAAVEVLSLRPDM